MGKTSGTSSSALRTLRVLIALKGHTHTGLSNGELAKALNVSPANISRDLSSLVEVGLAIKLDNGRFAHSVQMLQIATAHAEHVARLQARMDETNQRILAGSR
ncbi:helix-turn-helix domain-containing protein [Serratia fonticola]|uniref:helix-turn-helix domain-containing protein n=1 Tax=Serratia fonticola TaxID=47917 RepID=UPI001376C075|nr:helix-turn-helix domain-containing protein [Serratia fonticola]NCG55231.1 helix-turn-helix domain-containing protein [Serratia fonticola]